VSDTWRSDPDWWMVIFTFLAVVFAGVSALFFYWQLQDTHAQLSEAQKTARLEQQAWIQIAKVNEKMEIHPNEPFTVPIRMTNTGKIPASKILSDAYLEIVEKDHSPTFDLKRTHAGNFGGVLFPSNKFDIDAKWLLPNSSIANPSVLPQEIYDRLMSGEAYVAVYALLEFSDSYGDHWQRWCQWQGFHTGEFHAKSCVDFNAVSPN
jgi:hypothetical protein